MEVLVNGHVYWVTARSGEGYTDNPDYVVQYGGGGSTNPLVGWLVWTGTDPHPLYKVLDVYGETLGGGVGLNAALSLIDARVNP